MTSALASDQTSWRMLRRAWHAVLAVLCVFQVSAAHALPVFARQTGQSCVACHAGGQFPELTPYGRMFKLSGYTIGERTIPIAAMAIGDLSKTRFNSDANGNPINSKDGLPMFDFASVFLAGKITDKIGSFAQFTYINYDHQDPGGRWKGHWTSDNTDFRFVDRITTDANDLILGATVHNNPTVQDVFNSAPAWGYPYISSTISPVAKIPNLPVIEGGSLASQAIGTGAYLYWNKLVYAELTAYSTADGIWSFLSHGNKEGNPVHPQIYLRGYNPYARVALTRDWGAHSVMVGAFGLSVNLYPNDANNFPIFGTGVTRFRDYGLDAQYQYLLEPYTVTAQARYVRENIHDPNNFVLGDNTAANLNSLRLKASYVYQSKYGISLSFFNTTGTPDSVHYSASANFHPNTQGWMPEIFWMPDQRVRIGLQYTHFTKFLGATTNYDGNGRNARDNDTLFLYLWAASW